MLRGAERALEQHAVGQGTTGGRVDAGHRERLLGGERREQARQALGQHGLARPGWPHHQEVVPAGRRHFERVSAHGLSSDIGQIESGRGRRLSVVGSERRRGPGSLRSQNGRQVGQGGHPMGLVAADERSLTHIAEGHDQPERCGGVGQGDHPGDMTERAVEPELTTKGQAVDGRRGNLAGGHQHAHRNGQIEGTNEPTLRTRIRKMGPNRSFGGCGRRRLPSS